MSEVTYPPVQRAMEKLQALSRNEEDRYRAIAREHGLEESDAMLETGVEESDLGVGEPKEVAVDPCLRSHGRMFRLCHRVGHDAPPAPATVGSTLAMPTTSERPPVMEMDSATPAPSGARTMTD